MHPSQLQIKDYTYELPDTHIARHPLPRRDASRLLVCHDGHFTEDTYRHLDRHLPAHTLMVFNQTRVVHARLIFSKPTGGRIEVFCLEPDERYSDVQSAMLQQGEVYWKCLVGGAAKWKEGQLLSLQDETPAATALGLSAAVAERKEGYFILKLQWQDTLSFAEVLHIAGKVPLPPYLGREAVQADTERYQTIFAREEGSVAAPTAALHFTEAVMAQLSAKGITSGFVTLHVGAGTFRPVKSATMEGHDMHAEWIEAELSFVKQLQAQLAAAQPVVAVGTTSARTLESLYWIGVRLLRGDLDFLQGFAVPQWYPYEQPADIAPAAALEALAAYMTTQGLNRLITRTQIIIAPGYTYRMLSGLITNFHQPQSTLLLLVAALIGPQWRALYDHALAQGFRFLSYGDGCLLWNTAQA